VTFSFNQERFFMRHVSMAVSAAALCLLTAAPATAQKVESPAAPLTAAEADRLMSGRATAEERASVTTHRTTLNGRNLTYKATAGTLTIQSHDGDPKGSMFYVAYTVEQPAGAPPRPVTFLFNGGPGSASHWLNIGGIGPVQAVTRAPAATGPAPYVVRNSPGSILDKTDLVFIDAIGTGYSRPIGDTPGSYFWGTEQDMDSFARFITRYVTVNERWGSPKYLFGESYGTTRAAGLAYRLQNQGMQFNGVILLSLVVNGDGGADNDYAVLVPTYAATAWYHNAIANRPASLEAYMTEVREFARGPYTLALGRGHSIDPAEKRAVAEQLSRYIGLPVDYLMSRNLRVDLESYRRELLRDRAQITGRFDARFTAPHAYGAMSGTFDPATDDPATAGVSSAYLSTYRDYLSRDLNYKTPMNFRSLNNMEVAAAWDHSHRAPGNQRRTSPNVALDLAAAMRSNPQLKVLAMSGYYDMSTPFFSGEYGLDHMLLEPQLVPNVDYKLYESGHMAFNDQGVLLQMKEDLDAFYDRSLKDRP
jgi:carboxypeptidase C (cathepsin A)